MPGSEWAWVALGSNLGRREQYLAMGRAGLAAIPCTRLVAASLIEETAPLGPPGQGPYLNQMVLLRTTATPEAVWDAMQAIERAAGRRRTVRWVARTLDLDLVRFGELTVATPTLTIPHPELPNRPFWHRAIEELEPYVR